jgi:nucleotide-binding universal stress UspA family protein
MRILCGTDLLPKSDSAIARAGIIARRLDAELTLLYVAPLTESQRLLVEDMERARKHLESLAQPSRWQHGPSPHVCVRSGRAARILIETATQLGAGLVVLGTHRERMGDAIAGTLAERLLSKLRCPVLIVRRWPWHAYRNVLLALNRSHASANAVRAAEALVLPASARASVVYACRTPYEQRKSLRDLLEGASDDPSRYDHILGNEGPTAAVQDVARLLRPDLVVVGTRGRGRWRRAWVGSVANRILSKASSDVLAVPDRPARPTWRNARTERLALDVVSGV